MKVKISITGLILLTGLLIIGCSPASPILEPDSPTRTTEPTQTEQSPPELATTATLTPEEAMEGTEMPEDAANGTEAPGGLTDLESKLMTLAKQDLAERLDIDVEAIEVVKIEPIDWPDASLGCPAPDTMYAQVRTPGYRIALEAGGEIYLYHTDLDANLVFCDPSALPAPRGTPWWR